MPPWKPQDIAGQLRDAAGRSRKTTGHSIRTAGHCRMLKKTNRMSAAFCRM